MTTAPSPSRPRVPPRHGPGLRTRERLHRARVRRARAHGRGRRGWFPSRLLDDRFHGIFLGNLGGSATSLPRTGRPTRTGRAARRVVRAQRGDHEAFEQLAAAVAGRLIGTATLILRDQRRSARRRSGDHIEVWPNLPSLRDPTRSRAGYNESWCDRASGPCGRVPPARRRDPPARYRHGRTRRTSTRSMTVTRSNERSGD